MLLSSLLFFSAGDWTQGLAHKPPLCQRATHPASFSYFLIPLPNDYTAYSVYFFVCLFGLVSTFLLGVGNKFHQWGYSQVLQPFQPWALRVLGVAGHMQHVPTILHRPWGVVGCGLVDHGSILGVGTKLKHNYSLSWMRKHQAMLILMMSGQWESAEVRFVIYNKVK